MSVIVELAEDEEPRRWPYVPQIALQIEAHRPSLKNVGKSDCVVEIIARDLAATSIDARIFPSYSDNAESINGAILHNSHIRSSSTRAGSPLGFSPSPTRARWDANRDPFTKHSSSPSSFRPLESPRPALETVTHAKNLFEATFLSSRTVRRLTSGMWAVRKQAFGGHKQDGTRFLKQIEKQLLFAAQAGGQNSNAIISTPNILGVTENAMLRCISVDMQYIPFNDAKHLLLNGSKVTLEWLASTLVSLVDRFIKACNCVELGSVFTSFEEKAANIQKAVRKSTLFTQPNQLAEIEKFEEQVRDILNHYREHPRIQIPIGTCHGDLTLQNMLIDDLQREVCVFDFLDSFVESPLQDLAKLMQDCRHHWFFTQVPVRSNHIPRIVAGLRFISDYIERSYADYAFWAAAPLFEFFCLARVMPYMTTEDEKRCLMAGMSLIHRKLFEKEGSKHADGWTGDFGSILLSNRLEPHSQGITVLLPALGGDMARRYPSGKSKLLTLQPNGRRLIVDALSDIDMRNVSRIIVAVLGAFVLQECGSTAAFESYFDALSLPSHCHLQFDYFSTPTADVVDTTLQVLDRHNIHGPIFIKDSDNHFKHCPEPGNYATYLSVIDNRAFFQTAGLNAPAELMDPMAKSYVSFEYDNIVANMTHGNFISPYFCCGGWSFLSADELRAGAQMLRSNTQTPVLRDLPRDRLRLLDVQWQLILQDHLFFGVAVSEYDDWGSPNAWQAYRRTFSNKLISKIEIESALLRADGKERLRKVFDTPRLHIIVHSEEGDADVKAFRERLLADKLLTADTRTLQFLHSISELPAEWQASTLQLP